MSHSVGSKKDPHSIPIWKTRFFMVDEIQIEIGVSLSDECSILTEMGDIFSFGEIRKQWRNKRKRKFVDA